MRPLDAKHKIYRNACTLSALWFECIGESMVGAGILAKNEIIESPAAIWGGSVTNWDWEGKGGKAEDMLDTEWAAVLACWHLCKGGNDTGEGITSSPSSTDGHGTAWARERESIEATVPAPWESLLRRWECHWWWNHGQKVECWVRSSGYWRQTCCLRLSRGRGNATRMHTCRLGRRWWECYWRWNHGQKVKHCVWSSRCWRQMCCLRFRRGRANTTRTHTCRLGRHTVEQDSNMLAQ